MARVADSRSCSADVRRFGIKLESKQSSWGDEFSGAVQACWIRGIFALNGWYSMMRSDDRGALFNEMRFWMASFERLERSSWDSERRTQ